MKTSGQELELVHEILVLDAYLDAPLDVDAREPITRRFVDEALDLLGLEPLGALGIYLAADARAPGWSFVQPITTSHISAHYFERPGRAPHLRLDAYSCDRIDRVALLRLCHRHFRLTDWRATFIEREIDDRHARTVTALSGRAARVSDERRLGSTSTDEPLAPPDPARRRRAADVVRAPGSIA